ncbi:GNAT family N-acetyltransferase [Nocardioides sp.]|uniref:GNAT family N-acetyltransferase n=1 Tax=Nocardioides sp. TaxID=35761 RepID=UPI0035271386
MTATDPAATPAPLSPAGTQLAADVPAGLSVRMLRLDDARAVYEVMARQQQADLGRVDIEEADIVGDWQRPSFDVTTRTIGVFDGAQLVGYAELGRSGRCDAAVDPAYSGRGIGTSLARWMQARAAEEGEPTIGMPVPVGSPGDQLLEALGYRVRWTSWVLQLPDGVDVAPRDLPAGYTVREARAEEYPAAHEVIEDAFLEWSAREREPFADFEAEVVRRPGAAPWNLRVVVDPQGQVVAAGIVQLGLDFDPPEAFVSRLATRRDLRGQGLAQALLVDCFTEARRHGARRSGLSTDSRTGALGLYEKVGMVVTDTWVNRAIDVS